MEEWKDIPGYEKYQVSSLGRVRRGLRIIALCTDSRGYKSFTASIKNIKTTVGVHRALALAFIPQIDGKPEVDHINRNPSDNTIENLRWSNRCEQQANRFQAPGVSGHRYIVLDKNGWYRFKIIRNKVPIICVCTKSLPEAIEARDKYLTQINL